MMHVICVNRVRPDFMCFKCSVAQVCSLNCAKQVFQLPVRDLRTWRREQRTAVSCQAIIRTQRRTMCYVSHRLFRQSRACKHVAQQRSRHAHCVWRLVSFPDPPPPFRKNGCGGGSGNETVRRLTRLLRCALLLPQILDPSMLLRWRAARRSVEPSS